MNKLIAPVAASLMLACSCLSAAQATEIRISWWGGNSRHQATLKRLLKPLLFFNQLVRLLNFLGFLLRHFHHLRR